MSTSIKIGDIEITALNDGTSRLPAMFYPGLDVGVHPEVLDEDGTVHIPAGCFLVRAPSRTILVDAGIGPVTVDYPEGMPRARAAAGEPEPKLAVGGLLPELPMTATGKVNKQELRALVSKPHKVTC